MTQYRFAGRFVLGTLAALTCANAEELASKITLSVSADPSLPVKNLIVNPSFEDGVKGYLTSAKHTFRVVYDACSGMRAVEVGPRTKLTQHSCGGPIPAPTPGVSYIAAVMVKLNEKHRSSVFGGGIGGRLTLNYRVEGREQEIGQVSPARRSYHEGDRTGWTRAASEPLSASADAVHTFMKMTVASGWCKEPGIVDDVFLGEAHADLTVKAECPNGVYQVPLPTTWGSVSTIPATSSTGRGPSRPLSEC